MDSGAERRQGRPAPARDCGPSPDCGLCPRLATFRERNRRAYPDWHNAPVVSFGDPTARLLIVGLAPGLRGANRTGRPFTGDFAGDLLYAALARHGFSTGRFDARADDGLQLIDARITNAVRCVPPQNKPEPAEIATCRSFLLGEIADPAPKAILCLGRIAFESVLRAVGRKPAGWRFAHGAVYRPEGAPVLVATYHSSRYNVQTGRLTEAMFESAFATAVEAARA